MTHRTRIFAWSLLSLVGMIATANPAWGQRSSEDVAIELMRRWDADEDGQLTADEIPARARPAMDRIARQAGLDPDAPWPVEQLQKQLQKQTRREAKGKDGAGEKKQRQSPSEPAEEAPAAEARKTEAGPEPASTKVRGFGQSAGEPAVKGFDDGTPPDASPADGEPKPAAPSGPDAAPAVPREANGEAARIRRLAQGLLRRYDRNRSGVLEKEEWSRMRGDPEQSDANGDGVLTEDELVTRLAEYGRGSRAPATEPQRSPVGSASSPAKGTVTQRAVRDQGSRRSQRFLTATERLAQSLPRELRDWFLEKDRDGDGQIAMSEFGSLWTEQQAREFARLDLDNDGLITPREYVRAKGAP